LIYAAAIVAGIGLFLPGCGVVPQRKLEDSRLQIRSLQAENEQLRDIVLNVRSQNRDMSTRALDDARRIQALEDANRRLERSILAYQDENRQISALFDQLREQVRVAATTGPTVSMLSRVETLVARHQGVVFDEATQTLAIPNSTLFDGKSGRLTDEGGALLDDMAAALRANAAQDGTEAYDVEISGSPAAGGVELVSDDGVDRDARTTWLLNRLRDRVERGSGLSGEHFAVRALAAPAGDQVASAAEPMVSIRLKPRTESNSVQKP
jgi:hypothetical protein